MFLEIPTGFTFYSENTNSKSNYAYEKNGNLMIVGNVSFERLMYVLTYTIKDSHHCYYCNCLLKENTRTIDHQYPKMFGGISIPANMVPSCNECNIRKSNLTESQFKEYDNIDNKEKKQKYKMECMKELQKSQYSMGFFLPDEWFVTHTHSKIIVEIDLDNHSYRGKRYRKIKSFYDKYNRLPRPIIISSNNFLLDGFLILMFAKEHKISSVPTIILENVVCC